MTAKDYNSGNTSGMDGLTTLLSDFDPAETMERLEGEIEALGMRVFAKINHTALAAETGLPLLPTQLLIFGNPAAGTPLMQANQTMGIDLPLKVLVWQDASGKTWFTYNDPCWLANRHGVGVKTERTVDLMGPALRAMAKKVIELPEPD